MTANIETINKAKALEYLALNTKNRKPIRANVDFIKREILNDRFMFNGQSIAFDTNGTLIDGQHRLIAISELNKSVDMLVVRGLNPEAFKTIDTGRNRSGGDVLSMNNVPYANNISSAIQRILHKFHQSRATSKSGALKFSNTEILDFYKENKNELDEDIVFIANLYNTETKIITTGVALAMYYLLKRENKQKARSFIREIFTGTKETEDNSALTLRKRLLNMKIEGSKINDTLFRNLFISAFRGYCQGKNLQKIVVVNTQFFKEDE